MKYEKGGGSQENQVALRREMVTRYRAARLMVSALDFRRCHIEEQLQTRKRKNSNLSF